MTPSWRLWWLFQQWLWWDHHHHHQHQNRSSQRNPTLCLLGELPSSTQKPLKDDNITVFSKIISKKTLCSRTANPKIICKNMSWGQWSFQGDQGKQDSPVLVLVFHLYLCFTCACVSPVLVPKHWAELSRGCPMCSPGHRLHRRGLRESIIGLTNWLMSAIPHPTAPPRKILQCVQSCFQGLHLKHFLGANWTPDIVSGDKVYLLCPNSSKAQKDGLRRSHSAIASYRSARS